MPIVTTSRRRPHRKPPYLAVLLAVVVLLAVALLLPRAIKAPAHGAPPPSKPSSPAATLPSASTTPSAAHSPSRNLAASPSHSAKPASIPPASTEIAPSLSDPSHDTYAPHESLATSEPPAAHKAFPHATEQLLAIALSSTTDGGMPPLPDLSASDEHLLRDLIAAATNDIIIYDDENSQAVALKENVAAAKEQLINIVNAGTSVAEALKEYQNHVNENAAIRREVKSEVLKRAAQESDEAAWKYLDEANLELEKEGINPIEDEEFQ